MGNIQITTEKEPEEVATYLRQSKDNFELKWELKAKNDLLLPYFVKDDYDFIKTVGTGSFGRVIVCKKKSANEFVAVKCLTKESIIEKEQLEHTYSEYKILATVPPMPFLVNLLMFGQDNSYLYMAFEFIPGGELFSLLRSVGRVPEITATFYGYQVMSGLHYLHNMNILYRDLKPENILFAVNGYLKITDFGFAKKSPGRTYTLCGTPEYLAPEIILCQGYHKAVDWWAFGVLLFELVCGHPPFYSENPMEIYQKALEAKVNFTCKLSKECKDIIQLLLVTEPTKRIGNLKNGIKDISEHAFFRRLNSRDILKMKIKAPFIPELSSAGDTANFDDYQESPLLKHDFDKYADKFKDFPIQ